MQSLPELQRHPVARGPGMSGREFLLICLLYGKSEASTSRHNGAENALRLKDLLSLPFACILSKYPRIYFPSPYMSSPLSHHFLTIFSPELYTGAMRCAILAQQDTSRAHLRVGSPGRGLATARVVPDALTAYPTAIQGEEW